MGQNAPRRAIEAADLAVGNMLATGAKEDVWTKEWRVESREGRGGEARRKGSNMEQSKSSPVLGVAWLAIS
jgi:hypothetical protein